MLNTVQLENIEELRRQEGIDDVELRDEVGRLRPGDVVRITFVAVGTASETLPVRVTGVCGGRFAGELAARPSRAVAALPALGAAVEFAAAHIHSIRRR